MTDLKVDLKNICARLGLAETPELLEALGTHVQRGHHIGLLAGDGSGKGALIGLAALGKCDAQTEGIQALVLVPESRHGRRVAAAVQRVVGPLGLRVSRPGSSEAMGAFQVLVGRPSELLPDVRAGRTSLAAVRLVVIDGVAQMRDFEEWDSVPPIVESVSRECQKIAVSDRPDAEFLSFLDRQLPRARRWPEEILPLARSPESEEAPVLEGPAVLAALVPRTRFAEAVASCVSSAEQKSCGRLEIMCGSESRAAAVAADMVVSGRAAGAEGDVVHVDLAGDGPAGVVHLGLPFRLDGMTPLLDAVGPTYIVAEPRHGPQLDLLLRRASRRTGFLPVEAPVNDRDPIQQYRSWLRDETSKGDLLSEMLVLEPLYEEIGAIRLAAALSRNVRRRTERSETLRPWADVEEVLSQDATRTAEVSDRPPVGVRPAWTKLYFGVGKRDDAKPGDLVGAITGEAGIAGAQVGKIEIMTNFSLVDIDSQVADDVVTRLDGALIRGRAVPVRRDRNT